MVDTTSPASKFDISTVTGNAPDNIKLFLGNIVKLFANRTLNSFGKEIELRLKVTELSIITKADEPTKLEARAVLEIDVTEDMANHMGIIHGACLAFLIDSCSSYFALVAFHLHQTGQIHRSLSQSLNIVFHSPAAIGDRIRLINTTLTVGSRVESVRTEVWNVTHHRLVATAVHVKMQGSQPRAKAAL